MRAGPEFRKHSPSHSQPSSLPKAERTMYSTYVISRFISVRPSIHLSIYPSIAGTWKKNSSSSRCSEQTPREFNPSKGVSSAAIGRAPTPLTCLSSRPTASHTCHSPGRAPSKGKKNKGFANQNVAAILGHGMSQAQCTPGPFSNVFSFSLRMSAFGPRLFSLTTARRR